MAKEIPSEFDAFRRFIKTAEIPVNDHFSAKLHKI